MNATNLLEIADLQVRMGEQAILNGISLHVPAGGIVTVEYLFGFPGIGSALVDAVANRDMPVVQALVLLIAAVYVILNLIADILTILISPRLRTGLR